MSGASVGSQDLEVLSVAPSFGIGSVPFAGHEETYTLGLSRAAAAAGLPWTILAAETAAFTDGPVVPCLDRSSPATIAASLERHLRGRPSAADRLTCIVVYEGSSALAVALAPVAAEHPSVRFLVNLFHAERGLDVPLVRRKRHGTQRELLDYAPEALVARLAPLAEVTWPENLRITAETDAKALLARSVGIPVMDVWRLHSALAERGASADRPARRRRPGAPVRVLIAARSSQLHPPLVGDVIEVMERVARVGGGSSTEWVMAGRFDDHPRVRDALRRLERAGVRLDRADRPLEPDAYAGMFLDVDAVWMPTVWPYRAQSSGKALDALVLGRPILAPAGTAPALAMQRWVPGAPAYGSLAEAAQTFLRLPSLIGLLQAELDHAAAAIRVAHHPSVTVAWLCERLGGEPSGRAELVGTLDHVAEGQTMAAPRGVRSGLASRSARLLRDVRRALQERR